MAIKKRSAGKPPKNEPNDVDAIQQKIDDYFNNLPVDKDGVKEDPAYCGLALALGYSSRQSLWENANSDKPISLPIKIALLRIELSYEKMLRYQVCTGAIFALKNRGWTDKPVDETKDETIARLLEIVQRITGQS